MRLFKWTNAHAAYVPEIDAEHRNIYRIGDELQQAATSGSGQERIQAAATSLIAALEEHFTHEERLMRSSHYPILNWHKQQHDGARRRMRQYLAAVEREEAGAALMMAEYLSHWIKDHACLTDMMLAAYLRNHGRLQAMAS